MFVDDTNKETVEENYGLTFNMHAHSYAYFSHTNQKYV